MNSINTMDSQMTDIEQLCISIIADHICQYKPDELECKYCHSTEPDIEQNELTHSTSCIVPLAEKILAEINHKQGI